MFTLFHDPFYYGPTYWFQQPRYSRRQSLFERYLDALDPQFFSILKGNASELLGLENENVAGKSKTPLSAQSSESTPSSSPAPAPAPPTLTPTPDTKSKSTDSTQDLICQILQYRQQYVSHTKFTFNGRDYVEEH
jgi:hypothetical protein